MTIYKLIKIFKLVSQLCVDVSKYPLTNINMVHKGRIYYIPTLMINNSPYFLETDINK